MLLVDSIRGKSLNSDDKWLYEAGVFSAKIFNHIGTLYHLSEGTPLKIIGDQERRYIDHASITVIVRAAFETYLTFYYIYCDPAVSMGEKRFRHLIWKIGGFRDRQNFGTVRPENIPKLEAKKALLEKLLEQVKNTSIYLDLDSKWKRAARSGNWRYGKTWPDIAEIEGFNRKVFRDVYSYLCSYAYSGQPIRSMQPWLSVVLAC